MFYVYILEDSITEKKYIGYTQHLRTRIRRHQSGDVFTTRPWKNIRLIYAEYYRNKLDAVGREKFLKSGAGWRFLKKQLRNYLAT